MANPRNIKKRAVEAKKLATKHLNHAQRLMKKEKILTAKAKRWAGK